ncbi:MAG: glycoside hydrolase family 18 [Chitinophagaceae bacterium]
MERKLRFPFLIMLVILYMGCSKQNTPEALQLQVPKTYSDEYYANLRAYKKTDHQICYGWYSEYSQVYSYAQHFMGLPDSIDIISLWGGIPSLKQNDSLTSYNPTAYKEMRYVREVKGTRMLAVKIIRMQAESWTTLDSIGIINYGKYLLRMVTENDLDGLDMDYEPEGDYLTGNNLTILVKYLGQFLGPQSPDPSKLLVCDYYSTIPPAATEPYISYYVNQAYTQGTTTNSAANLQSRYNLLSSWCPSRKFIVTENLGDWWQNGGSPFTEANGNTISPVDGTVMYSLEGMARWQPTQGKKAGWGAFFFVRDYNLDPPYKYMRRCIQIANPAVH